VLIVCFGLHTLAPSAKEDGPHRWGKWINECIVEHPLLPVSDANSLLQSLLGSSGDCIKILDLKGNLVFMTEGGQRLMEVTDFGVIRGCPWPDFWEGKGNIAAKAAVKEAQAGKIGHFQGFATTMAGTPKWWDVTVTLIRDAQGKADKLLSVSRDITQQHLADKALQDSEYRLRMALQAGRLGHWDLDLATGVLTASDVCKENFGRISADDFTYEDLCNAVAPEDQPRMREAVERSIATGGDYDIEYRVVKPNGMSGWVLIRGKLVQVGDEPPSRMSGVSLDISDLKAAEQALLESEARFKTFAQAMPNQIWSATTDGLLDWFNEQVFSYSGLTFEDLAGNKWAQMVHADDIGTAASIWSNALQSGTPYQIEFRLRRADGSYRWHLGRALPIRDEAGQITRWIGTNTDIDNQKEIEEQLFDSQQSLEIAINAADIGTWDFDPQSGVLKWDKRCYQLFGLTPGKPISFEIFLSGVHPQDRDETEKACLEAMRPDGANGYDIEYRTIGLEDGVERWCSAKGKASFENGVATRFIGTIRDISKLKRAELQQRLLTRELEHRMKNTMAMVGAIASQTFRTATTKEEARTIFDARLNALNHAHDVLVRSSWTSAPMATVVEGALAPHRTGEGRIRTCGPSIDLTAKQALSLALALHELATNAAKYGALSVPGGKVDVTWDCTVTKGSQVLSFLWRETGGPIVAPPSRRGFGSRLIESTLSSDFGNSVKVDYLPEGVVCRFQTKLSDLAGSEEENEHR
jgi:PAS domain S-box-containing protein